MRFKSVALLLSTTLLVSGATAALSRDTQEIATTTPTLLKMTESQFDAMHKVVDDIHHDLGHIDSEMNRHQEIATYAPWFTDWGYGWYPPLYDGYPGIMLGPDIGQSTAQGPLLPPRKDVLERSLASLNEGINSLAEQVQAVKLPPDAPSDINVQMQVLQGIVPSLQSDYTKLSALLNVNSNYDRQAIASLTERIKDDAQGIDVLRKRMHRLLKDDK